MYTLHIDESGVVGDFKKEIIVDPDNIYFVLGGIITQDLNEDVLKSSLDTVIRKYLDTDKLGKNFKLHYRDIRQNQHPYDSLDELTINMLTSDIFKLITNERLWLISSCVNLHDMHENCSHPESQRYLTLSSLIERFNYFLDEKHSSGKIIHEFVEKKTNRRLQIKFGNAYKSAKSKNSKLYHSS